MLKVVLSLMLAITGSPAFAQDFSRPQLDPEQANMALLAATRHNLDLTYHPGFNLVTNERDVPLSLQPDNAPPPSTHFKGLKLYESKEFVTEVNGKGLFYRLKDSVLGGAFVGRATEKSVKFTLQWGGD